LIFLLDTNVASEWLGPESGEWDRQVEEKLNAGETVGICQPVYYELTRGLLWKNATRKLAILRDKILPQLQLITLQDEDWLQAAEFWAEARRQGRQLADIDLLIAALAYRLSAVIVSRDTDFDVLPVKREDWR
jgi:predicted nucleic acid-binding protein